MTTTSVDVESFSDTVSPDALEAITRKGGNKPDISRLPDAIVGGAAQFGPGDKIVIERYSSFLKGKPYLDTKTYRVVRLDEFTGRIHLFDEQLDQNAIVNWKESLKFGTVFKLATAKMNISTKKKRGRPRKNPIETEEVKPAGEKKGRGRPKGAKNRPKEEIKAEKEAKKAERARKAMLKAKKRSAA
jgi:hypothetical protein